MAKLSTADQEEYAAWVKCAEQGELKPQGPGVRGEEATAIGRDWILTATGASSIEEAVCIALC